jgi:AmmeMemoRadiSam system protein A
VRLPIYGAFLEVSLPLISMKNELVSQEEGKWLIELARNAIHTVFDQQVRLLSIGASLSLSLYQKRGVFVGLWMNGAEVNCIGHPLPNMMLEEAVQQYVIEIAQQGKRFSSLKVEDLDRIQIKLSIMTHPVPIVPDQIEMGVHGLILKLDERLSVLLPEVPREFGWDLQTYLEKLCQKGGFPIDTWKKPSSLYGFTTQIIGPNEG